MKKLTVTLALVLCLVLCVFAFASCDKGDKKGTTAADTAPAGTTATTPDGTTAHVHTPASEYTIDEEATCTYAGSKSKHCTVCDAIILETVEEIPQLDHTPDTEYSTLTEPTCIAAGSKAYLCLVCGEPIESTIEEIPAEPTAHKVEEWSATPTLLNPSVEATGECTVCHQNIPKTLTYEPPIKTFTDKDNQFRADKVTLGDIRGEKHFYPTDSDPDGNDLFVEFSILWDESLLNLDTAKNCYIVGHMGSSDAFLWVSPVPGIEDSYGQFSGAFECVGKYQTPISDDEVTTPATMCAQSPNYSDYPNIAGTDPDNPQWGWHRVGIRIHMELLPGKTGEDKKDYYAVVTTFVDGVVLFKLSNATKGLGDMVGRLFTAESDGNGGVVYGDADENAVSPIIVNHTQTKLDTKAYFAIDDVSVTCGKDFVMQVEKVAAPTAATYEVEEGVEVTTTIWFKLAES